MRDTLRLRIAELGVRQGVFAEYMGMTHTRFCSVLQGRLRLRPDFVRRLDRLLTVEGRARRAGRDAEAAERSRALAELAAQDRAEAGT